MISYFGLVVASINLIINNQIKYTRIFWSLILDLQEILIAETVCFILYWGLNIKMNFFQWTDVSLRYLDCLCLFVSNLQPVDSCNILTYCFLIYVVLSYRNYIYVTLQGATSRDLERFLSGNPCIHIYTKPGRNIWPSQMLRSVTTILRKKSREFFLYDIVKKQWRNVWPSQRLRFSFTNSKEMSRKW